MRKEIKKVDPMSLAKLYGAIYGTIGFIIGLFMGVFSSVVSFASTEIDNAFPFAGMGLASIILFPIIYGILGAIVGIIGAFLYNFFASKVGGVIIEVEDSDKVIL